MPGPQAVGQVLGVQNSDSALENRFMCLKKATAERDRQKNDTFHNFPIRACVLCGEKGSFNVVHSLLLASHSALSTPGGSAERASMSVWGICLHKNCCCKYGRSPRLLLLIPLGGRRPSVNEADRKKKKVSRCKTINRSLDYYPCCSQQITWFLHTHKNSAATAELYGQ